MIGIYNFNLFYELNYIMQHIFFYINLKVLYIYILI